MAKEIEYIAQDCASLFVQTEDKNIAAEAIINKINNLSFEDNTPLGNKDKEYIILLIGEFIANKKVWKYKYGGLVVAPSAFDNDAYIKLIDYILSQIKK